MSNAPSADGCGGARPMIRTSDEAVMRQLATSGMHLRDRSRDASFEVVAAAGKVLEKRSSSGSVREHLVQAKEVAERPAQRSLR